jgi:hypothetical protein
MSGAGGPEHFILRVTGRRSYDIPPILVIPLATQKVDYYVRPDADTKRETTTLNPIRLHTS